MSTTKRDYSAIPASACTLVVGDFSLGDNGPEAKTAPIRLVARTGKPIEHAFWGRIVHDLSGMHLHKPRLPVDYAHDDKEIIGYLNKFDTATGDLVASGALVPFKDSDRATEIIHKSKAGVPYEASIFFGGDGIKLQVVEDGMTDSVNGYQFDGPGVIVREWPLRGVAICPYGADANTDTAVFSRNKNQVFSASVVTAPEPEAATKESREMNADTVDVGADGATQPEAELTKENAQAATPPAEESVAEVAKTVDTPPVEPAQPQPQAQTQEPETKLSRADFIRIVDEFGAEVAAATVRDNGDYHAALAKFAGTLKTENEMLRRRVAELEAQRGQSAQPVTVVAAPNDPNKGKLFKTGK